MARIEVTGVRNVNTQRGAKAIVQIMWRDNKGVNVVEQWMDPAKAPTVGQYEAGLEIYGYNNRLGAAFTDFKPVAKAAA